jgi:hypothetical protein
MSIPIIIRRAGPVKRKYGILTEYLKPYHIRLLNENPLVKDDLKTNDQFVKILFKMADMEQSHKHRHKFYYNQYTDTITTYEDIIEHSKWIDWSCAICNVEMLSMMADFSVCNFVCTKCEKAHNSNNGRIDPRIVDSSFEFHKYCRKLLIKEQKKFLLYIKYFETGYKRGRR